MRFNGVDPTTLHAGISIAKEIPPGAPTSQLETLTGSTGEIVAGRTLKQAEYIVRINIAGKSRAEAWDIRARLAAWAGAAETTTHELIPSHWQGYAYDAILKEISPPEFTFGFAVVDVIFTIPRPIAHGTVNRTATKSTTDGSGVSLNVNVLGSSYIRPTIQITTLATSRVEITVSGTVYAAVGYNFAAGDILKVQCDPPAVEITSGGNTIAADRYVDYTVTDFEALCKALTPGIRYIGSAQASRIYALWREEFL